MNHLDACQQDLLQTGTRKLRPLLLSVLCLVACHVVAGEEAVLAQRRVPANGQVETPSQRVLPLPEGGSTDLRQQVEWLRQLKGLLGAGGELPKLPPIDAEQMKLLREAMKQFGGGRSDGTQPPAFDGNSLEQVSKALADPAMREQVRKALEQFQRDGKSPRDAAAADSSGAPLPLLQPGQSRAGEQAQPGQGRPSTGPSEESSEMPQALRDLLKRLSPPADRPSDGASPEREPAGDAAAVNPLDGAKRGSANRNATNRDSAKPDISPMPPGGSPSIGRTDANGQRPSEQAPSTIERSAIEPSNSGRANSGRPNPVRPNSDRANPETRPEARSQTRSTEPNPLDDRRPSGQEPRMTQPQVSPGREPRLPDGDQPSTDGSPRGTTQPPGVTSPPGLSPRGSSRDSNASRPSASRTPDPRPAPSGDSNQSGDQVASRDRSPRRPTMPLNPEPSPLEPRSGTVSPSGSSSRSGASRPSMDVRSELEQQGFARTLQKLVEQAREDSLAAPSGASGATGGAMPIIEGSRPGPNELAGRGGSSAGSPSSMSRIMDGLQKGLSDAASESRSNPALPSGRTESARTSPSTSPVERPSTLSNVTKSANNMLSNIVTAPAPRPAPVRSTGSASSGGMTVPQGGDSRSMIGLLMLLAVLGVVWYFTPQWIAAIGESQRKPSIVGDVIHPADIRSRVDVVRAFHQFALRPATLAAEWWTHRAVEQQVAQESPALQPAIQTLTDLYEQARYLPDDADFGPDQIGSARQALEECEASLPIVG